MGGECASISPSLANLSELVPSAFTFKFPSPTLQEFVVDIPYVTAVFLRRNKSTAIQDVERGVANVVVSPRSE